MKSLSRCGQAPKSPAYVGGATDILPFNCSEYPLGNLTDCGRMLSFSTGMQKLYAV
jgi:hypothetical protein